MNTFWLFVAIVVSLFSAITALSPFWLPRIFVKIKEIQRKSQARKSNNLARKLRLKQTTWQDYPMPVGKRGSLRITEKMLITNYVSYSLAGLQRIYIDRGRDMKVDLNITQDVLTRDIVITWKPHCGFWPREKY